MLLRILAFLLAVAFSAALIAAKPKKRGKKAVKPAAQAETAKAKGNDDKIDAVPEEKGPAEIVKTPEPVASGDEMEAYRQIQNRQIVIVQDLADLLLMYQGEFSKYKTSEKRLQHARELGFITAGYEPTEELPIGLLAHALVKKYDPEKGWLYWLTGWERYALRDAQEAGMIPQKASPNQRLSGEQLFAIMTDAEEFATKRSEWEKGE